MDHHYIHQKNLNPKTFYENITESNDLSAFIDSTDRTILTKDEVWSTFINSFKTTWLSTAKEFDFMSNKIKFLNYVNTKFEEEINEYNNKKRKFNNNINNQKSTS